MEELANEDLTAKKLKAAASTEGNTSSTLNQFGSYFRTFPLRFDEWNFTYWWMFLIAFYLIWGILIGLWDTHTSMVYHGFLCQTSDYYFVSTNFNCSLTEQVTRGDYPYHFFVIGQFLLLLLFNRWRKKIPVFFQDLQSKKVISSSEEPGSEYLKFLAEYQRKLLSKKRYIFIGSLFLAALIYFFLWLNFIGFQNSINVQMYKSIGNGISVPSYISDLYLVIISNIRTTFEWLSILLPCYFVAVGGWVIYTTGLYIDKLTTSFKLNIQPDHPDKCGGLEMLGSLCLSMATIIVLLAVFQSLYGLTINPKSFWSLATLDFMVPFVLVLAYLAFWLPLFHIHHQMLGRKDEDENEYTNRISKLKLDLRSSLDNKELDKAKIIKEEIEITQILIPSKTSYQTWPFNTGILLTFFLPQIVPILSIIIPLITHG